MIPLKSLFHLDVMLVVSIHPLFLLLFYVSDPRVAAAFLACWAYVLIYYIATPLSQRLYDGYKDLPSYDQAEWNHRVYYTFDQFFCASSAMTLLLDDSQPSIWSGLMVTNANCEVLFCYFLGYLVSDLVFLLKNHKTASDGWLLVLHHIFLISSYVLILVFGFGHLHGIFGLFTEITTPLLATDWFLTKMNMRHKKMYTYNRLFVTLLYFAVRIVMQAYFTFLLFAWLDDFEALPKAVFYIVVIKWFLFIVLNIYWFILLSKGTYKHMFSKKIAPVIQ